MHGRLGRAVTAATDLNRLLTLQRDAFRRDPYPAARERQAHLEALRRLLVANADAFAAAIDADFGHRSKHETKVLEDFPYVLAARHARRHVDGWMSHARR